MPPTLPDPTRRFSDRVLDYVRYRPGYPDAVREAIRAEAALVEGSPVADVGSGTGISSELLLRAGCTVHAVEPNEPMRAAAEAWLGSDPRFHSVDGTAEATTLPDASVVLVTPGQAFHWFEPGRARAEFARILRPGGRVALFWNSRLADASAFLLAYEALLRTYGTDYRQINHRNVGPERIRDFLRSAYSRYVFPNEQAFDYEGLKGRLLSSSYAPAPGHPRHDEMIEALRRIFDEHQDNGRVRLLYETELHLGRVE